MGALQDILKWSEDRPLWQQDALRRVVSTDYLSTSDLEELTLLCLEEHGIVDEVHRAPEAVPLAQQHLPKTQATLDRVQLAGIKDVKNVNILASDQKMGFQLDGLTVVFGYNGSGKSGYARILRSVCHARHQGDQILPDVFGQDQPRTPSATIDFREGDTDQTLQWEQGRTAPSELQQVGFFDAECASVHVDEANELAFTPFGLDVMPKLVRVCHHIQGKIHEMITEQNNAKPVSLAEPQAADGTDVRRAIDQIDQNSRMVAFRDLAALSDDGVRRLYELQGILATNPLLRAKELRNTAQRLDRLRSKTLTVIEALSDDAIDSLKDMYEEVKTKREAAQSAADEAFGEQPLAGVGEKVWHELWKAARAYSTERAYPDQSFPYTENGALCVLCQQPLTDEAGARLNTFERFIQSTTQKEADDAHSNLNSALSNLERLSVGRSYIDEHLPDIPTKQAELKKAIRRFHAMSWKRKRKVLLCRTAKAWEPPCNLPETPVKPLGALINQFAQRADEVESSADEDERNKLLQEKKGLEARQWLAGVLGDVEREISRKKRLASLRKALTSVNTTGITRQSTTLSRTYVTDVLCNKMTEEINALGAGHLRVELEPKGGQQGAQRFQVALDGAANSIRTKDVLSEGEFRCIALAGFLAELSTEQSGSALVFDDPVSSLDHKWRRRVAERIVGEVTRRQVVVFTHEIGFLTDLREFCEKRALPSQFCYLRRGIDRAGECFDQLPWPTMKLNDRIKCLNRWLQEARNLEGDAYESEARRLYGLLRECWERAVEEVLLNGVITRFERGVQTMRLRHVKDINEEDIKAVDEGMSKCSRFLAGHDEPAAVMDPVPIADELQRDISELKEWVKTVRTRRE